MREKCVRPKTVAAINRDDRLTLRQPQSQTPCFGEQAISASIHLTISGFKTKVYGPATYRLRKVNCSHQLRYRRRFKFMI